jgi:hypothetical protein
LLHERLELSEIELVQVVHEFVPSFFVRCRPLLEIFSKLFRVQEGLGHPPFDFAVGNGEHDFDATYTKNPVVQFEASLETLAALVVRQTHNEKVKGQANQGTNAKIIKNLVPSLRVGERRTKAGVGAYPNASEWVFVRQEHYCHAHESNNREQEIE